MKRHRWEYWDIYHRYCRKCGVMKSQIGPFLSTVWNYLHRDGKWHTKCPPCKPEKVREE